VIEVFICKFAIYRIFPYEIYDFLVSGISIMEALITRIIKFGFRIANIVFLCRGIIGLYHTRGLKSIWSVRLGVT
jgi:hypothetical protein